MRREERVTVQGPVKEQQPDGMSHKGARPPPPLDAPRSPPLPTLEADSHNFATAPLVPRGFKLPLAGTIGGPSEEGGSWPPPPPSQPTLPAPPPPSPFPAPPPPSPLPETPLQAPPAPPGASSQRLVGGLVASKPEDSPPPPQLKRSPRSQGLSSGFRFHPCAELWGPARRQGLMGGDSVPICHVMYLPCNTMSSRGSELSWH